MAIYFKNGFFLRCQTDEVIGKVLKDTYKYRFEATFKMPISPTELRQVATMIDEMNEVFL